MKRAIKNVQVSQDWLALLAHKHPELTAHGNAWAIEALIADRLGLQRPRTPDVARRAGAATRGAQLKNRPALNPAGRKGAKC